MTIKRRLFLSNILMLVIPVILSLLTAGGMLIAFSQPGIHDGLNEKLFQKAIIDTNELIDKWSQSDDLAQMKADADIFNEQFSRSGVSLSIYQGKNLLYPSVPLISGPALDLALALDGSHSLTMDNNAVFRDDAGEYSVILADANFISYSSEAYEIDRNSSLNLAILMFLSIITIILLTNRFLTRVIFKSIITPLDTLVYGVHQIRDGNLSYRIAYAGKDEFAGICSDFNEMAQYLLDFVNARQKDEVNRKELIAGISHDLRTPLTSIKAYVEGIEKGVASTPQIQKRYLDTIKNKTNDLEHIIDQLFLFSKLDLGDFPFYLEQVNIGKELANLITAVAEEYERKGLCINFTPNSQTIMVQVDAVQLRNAVTNILENSVKYKDKEQGKIMISCQADDHDVTVTLADNGPGVPEKALARLFDVFYRSDPSRSNPSKGSGLGLSITAKILERLGGTIRAENGRESGLTIVMMLPRYRGGKNK